MRFGTEGVDEFAWPAAAEMNLRSASGRSCRGLAFAFKPAMTTLRWSGLAILLLPRHHPDGQHRYDDCDELE